MFTTSLFALLTASSTLAAPSDALATDASAAAAASDLVRTPPMGCLVYLEMRRPQVTVDTLEKHEVLGALIDALAEQALAENAGLVELVDGLPGEDESLAAALGRIAGDGFSAWLTLEQFEPVVSLAIAADDEVEGDARRDALLRAIERLAGAPTGSIAAPSETAGEVRIWSLGDELFVADKGTTTYLSNSRNALDPIVRERRRPRGRRALERLIESHGARANDSEVFAWVDIGAINAFAALAGDQLGEDGPARFITQLNELPRDPQVQSLLGSGIASIGQGRSWSLTLDVDRGSADVALYSDGIDAARPLAPTGPAPVGVSGDGELAHAFLYRDFGTLLKDRATLFEATDLANIAMTVSQLELFLGGMTLSGDVLPGVSPWIEVVARELEFTSSPRPDLQLPAAAFVFDISADASLGEHLDAAFQGLVAVTNIERAERGEPALRLELGRDGEHTWTAAHYPTPGDDRPVDARYNFAPAAAQVGSRWIVATHEELLVAMLGEVAARNQSTTAIAAGGPVRERLVVDGPSLAAIAEPQLDALALMHSLDEGIPREQAREDMAGLVWLLERTEAALEIRYGVDSIAIAAHLAFPGGTAPTTGAKDE